MKHLIPFLSVLFILAMASCNLLAIVGCNSGGCIQGSGNQVSEMRVVEPFSSVKVGGNIKLIVTEAPEQQLRITADDNILKEITTKVRKNQLIIEVDNNFCEQTPVIIYATSRQLEGVDVSGAVEVIGEGRINCSSFDLNLSGASQASLDISCGDMNTHTSGASKVVLKGQAGNHDIKMSGASELNAFDFVVGNYNISTSGASNLKINVLNELNVESSGSSEISYRGNPKHITNDKSGASSIKRVN